MMGCFNHVNWMRLQVDGTPPRSYGLSIEQATLCLLSRKQQVGLKNEHQIGIYEGEETKYNLRKHFRKLYKELTTCVQEGVGGNDLGLVLLLYCIKAQSS